jgi:hypothetical protein
MKASVENIEEIIDFKGRLGLPSKCGFRRIIKGEKQIVLVTELYQENPGSSITSVSASLAMQISERFQIPLDTMVYIESSPDMKSKLSFYDEVYYEVTFENVDGKLTNPSWKKLTKEEFKNIIG